MVPEAAIKIINGIECVEGRLPDDGLLVEEAFNMAVEALEKQITKSPVKSKKPRCGMGYEYYDWECPACGTFLAPEPNVNKLKQIHHCICGQRLKLEES